MNPTGRPSAGRSGQIDRHICLVTSPCSWLTPLTAPLVRSASAVMLNIGPPPLSWWPSAQELLAIVAQVSPRAGEVRFDQRERERVVAGGDRRVRREHRRPPHLLQRVVEAPAALAQVADALQHDERGVAFVEVVDRRLMTDRLEHADAADAEDDLLLDARLAVAAVEPRRQLAIPRRVFFEVRVEQIQLHAADAHAPHRHEHGAIAERHRGDRRLAVGSHGRLDRRFMPVQLLVDLLLPPVGRQPLMEVALRIHEADADQRHAEVAGLLAVIAGEHAEAAGIDRQRLVQRELGREVGDGLAVQVRDTHSRTRSSAPRVRHQGGPRCGRSSPATRDCRWPPSAPQAGSACSMRTGLCAVCRHSG